MNTYEREQRRRERDNFIKERGLPDSAGSTITFELTDRGIPLEVLERYPDQPLVGESGYFDPNSFLATAKIISEIYGYKIPTNVEDISSLRKWEDYLERESQERAGRDISDSLGL